MKKKIQASIIIRTKNEEQWIESCLTQIFNQKKISFEVILVDNNSTDKTVAKAKKFNVKVIKISKYFPGKAINIGASKANGKYIVCLSAHCIPENDLWLANLIKNLDLKNIAAVYGKQKPLPYSSSFDKRDLYNLFGDDRRIQKKDTFFHNANSAIKRDIWIKYKFDEKTPHIEDRIWSNKILKKNYKIIYEPKASVFHWHGINQEMDQKRCDKIVEILENLDMNYKSNNVHDLKKMNIVAIIPIKGESKVINKVPLINRTIDYVKSSKYIKKIFVSTDNKNTQLLVKKEGAQAPFLRPKNLSEDYFDLNSILKYTLEKLEKKNILIDLVVLMTENFPIREKNLHDKMIEMTVQNNYDSLLVVKKEKGTILTDSKIIIDDTIPRKMIKQEIFLSRLGICTILRPHQIRKGKILDGKVGIHKINEDISFIDFKNDKKNLYRKLLSN